MEKSLVEHSTSFSHHKNDNNTNIVSEDGSDGKTLPGPAENVDHAIIKDEESLKQEVENVEEEIKKTEEDDVDAKGKKEEEEDVVAEIPPETPPPRLENVFEDIDAYINANSTSEIPDFVHMFLDIVEEKITSYDTGKTKWGEAKEEDSSLLEAIDRISKLIKLIPESLISSSQIQEEEEEIDAKNVKDSLMKNRIGAIHQQAMSYLEDEFQSLIDEPQNRIETDPSKHNSKGKHVTEAQPQASDSEPGSERVPNFPGYGDEAISNLNNIAMKMISGGYQPECYNIYFISRKHALEESLHKLGLEKISIDDVHKMQWEALERDIPKWNNTFKECMEVYFPGERKLAEAVFSDHREVADSVFMMVCHRMVIRIVNFAEAIALTKRSGEKLFKFLDMYETLRDLNMNLDNLFPQEFVEELKAETTSAKCRLGESIIVIFCELENSIKSDTGKTPVAGGAVHPLTRYIMNYLKFACEYKDTLEDVFKEHSKIERADSTSRPYYEAENKNENHRVNNNSSNNDNNNNKENVSPFAAQLMRVMELLDSNLEGKANLYKDSALSSIFMMNNGRYIVQKIKGSPDLYKVMGETWCRKRSSNLRTYHKNYQIETWSKILGCLSPKGLNDNGKVHKHVLKERFKSFNALFEEIHKTQSTWVVSDEQLQSELRVSISALVIPAYRSFLGRFSQYLALGRQTEKYIKFQAEDIETYIDELFDGNPHHQSLARKKA